MEKLAYTVSGAAAALGVSKKIIYDLVHRADFPALRTCGNSGRILIPARGLTEWLDNQAKNGGIL